MVEFNASRSLPGAEMTDAPIGSGSARFVTIDWYVFSPTAQEIISRSLGLKRVSYSWWWLRALAWWAIYWAQRSHSKHRTAFEGRSSVRCRDPDSLNNLRYLWVTIIRLALFDRDHHDGQVVLGVSLENFVEKPVPIDFQAVPAHVTLFFRDGSG